MSATVSKPPVTSSFAGMSAPTSVESASPASEEARLYPRSDSSRHFLEQYIHQRYQQFYGADVKNFSPWLFACWQQAELRAVLGLRAAGTEPLFVENYLSEPIELVASRLAGRPVARDTIIEVGNLAGSHGGSQLLFILLTELLYLSGFEWVCFTATGQVSSLLRRLDLAPALIGRARPECLGSEAGDWGSYYDRSPAVLMGHVAPARELLRSKAFISKVLEEYHPMLLVAAQQLRGGNTA